MDSNLTRPRNFQEHIFWTFGLEFKLQMCGFVWDLLVLHLDTSTPLSLMIRDSTFFARGEPNPSILATSSLGFSALHNVKYKNCCIK